MASFPGTGLRWWIAWRIALFKLFAERPLIVFGIFRKKYTKHPNERESDYRL
jgi:hypothetical protein